MKLLVVSQYFWPENFRINDLVAELVSRGHEVVVLTGKPNYPDGEVFPEFKDNPLPFGRYAGAEIVRIPMLPRHSGSLALMLNYLSFAVMACLCGPFKLRRHRFDAVFCFGASPVTVALPAILMKWLNRASMAFWVLDLWPQSLEAVGAVKSRAILDIVDRMVGVIYAGCDLVLAQSRSFIPEIARHVHDPARIAYFPSWSETLPGPESVAPAAEVVESPGNFDIVFTGNIGEAQDFPAILGAASLLKDQRVRWLIVGSGRKDPWVKAEIERLGLENSVLMLGRFSLDRMPSFFRHADALLVALRKEPIFALTIPGKVQTYLAAGVPVLAMLDGEGADVVVASGAGYSVDAGDSAALAEAVKRLMALTPEARAHMGQQGLQFSKREFDRSTLISRLEEHLTALRDKRSLQ